MRTLETREIAHVSGAALDPELGFFPRTGIAIIDNIHKAEWNSYGKYLYQAGAWALSLFTPKA